MAPLPQPAELVTPDVTGVDDVGVGVEADVGVDDADVEGLVAPVLPPQATSVIRSNAAHACLMFSPRWAIIYSLCNAIKCENLPCCAKAVTANFPKCGHWKHRAS